MQKIAQEVSPKLTEFSNSIYMNPQLFERVKQVYENKANLNLNPEQTTLLEDTWKSFINGGANLEGEAKERFKAISMELSGLGLKFEENLLAETNDFELLVTDEKDLAGLPESVKEAAVAAAKEKGKEGWLFTLHAPSYGPFLKYADNRDLREKCTGLIIPVVTGPMIVTMERLSVRLPLYNLKKRRLWGIRPMPIMP